MKGLISPPGKGFLSDKLRTARWIGTLPDPVPGTPCEHCGSTESVSRVRACTAYPDTYAAGVKSQHGFDLVEVDEVNVSPEEERRLIEEAARECPNRDRYLCPSCADEDISFWKDQWDEYYRELL